MTSEYCSSPLPFLEFFFSNDDQENVGDFNRFIYFSFKNNNRKVLYYSYFYIIIYLKKDDIQSYSLMTGIVCKESIVKTGKEDFFKYFFFVLH
jgi:hypothetical protein